MSVRRWLAATGAMVLVMAVANPAWAQGNDKGKKKPPKTSCDEASYPATVEFLLPEELRGGTDPIFPAIYAAGDPNPGSVVMGTTFADGIVRDYLQNPLVNGDPGSPLLPLHLDFSGGGSHYGDGDPDSDPTPHPLGSEQIDVDPRLSIWAIADLQTLETPECGMLGMVVDDSTSYVGRTGFLWRELKGIPASQGADSDRQWVLRHKASDVFGNPPTYTNIVRTDANTWMLTSRTLEEGSDPAHFASLERSGSGRGKNAEQKTFSKPIMPVQIVLTVDCNVDCAVPGGN